MQSAGVTQWHHLFLWPDHLRAASIGQEDAFDLGDTRAQREGAHPSIPALIPPLRGPRRGPPTPTLRLVPAWMAALTAESGG